MGLRIIQQPASEPISLAEAKEHLNITSSSQDGRITAAIKSARNAVEQYVKMALLPTTFRMTYDVFPFCFPWEFRLPVGPVFSSAGFVLKYIDPEGVEQTLADTEYKLRHGDTGMVAPAYGKSWPQSRCEPEAVTLDFVAGYSAISDIPPVVLQATYLTLGDFFAHRENTVIGDGANSNKVAELPLGVRALLFPGVRH